MAGANCPECGHTMNCDEHGCECPYCGYCG